MYANELFDFLTKDSIVIIEEKRCTASTGVARCGSTQTIIGDGVIAYWNTASYIGKGGHS